VCELCDLREKVGVLQSELSFRWEHLQMELLVEGRAVEAAQCEERIDYIVSELKAAFRKRRSLEIQGETITH